MISSPDKDRPELTATKPTNNSITLQPRHAPERKEMHRSNCEGMKWFLRHKPSDSFPKISTTAD